MAAVEHLSLDQFRDLDSQDYPGMKMHQLASGTHLDERTGAWSDHNERLRGVEETIHEGIKSPITLSRFRSQSGEERISVWDGHHRGVAAIRHGVDPVPVRTYDQDYLIKQEMSGRGY